jgi:hypothetical protein
MKTHPPLNTAIGLIIISLTLIAGIASFLSDGGIEYYAERPMSFVFVLATSVLAGFGVAIGSRLPTRFLAVLKVVGMASLALVLTACSLLLGYIVVRNWDWEEDPGSGSFRWVGVSGAIALGALAVATWRECCAALREVRNSGQGGQGYRTRALPPPCT